MSMWDMDIDDPWGLNEEIRKPKKLTTNQKRQETLRIKYKKILAKRVGDLRGLEINYDKDVQYRIVTSIAMNAIVVIEDLASKYEIEEFVIAVYRMNQRSVERIKELIESCSDGCSILLSSFFRENKRYEEWAVMLVRLAQEKNIRIGFAHSHAKVFLCKTACGKHIVFEGSGNLAENSRVEQYILENNKVTYDFHKSWIDTYIQEYEDESKKYLIKK